MIRVKNHDITLRFHLSTEDHPSTKLEMKMLAEMEQLPGWKFKDEYGFISDRFTAYQQEFDCSNALDNLPEGSSMFLVSFGAEREIPATLATKSDDWDVGYIRMITQVREIVERMLPTAKYIRSTAYKLYESSGYEDLPL